MKNQFFYTRKTPNGGTAAQPTFKESTDSFNVERVLRSMQMEDGKLLILLDDIHERAQEVPMRNAKGKVVGVKRERNVVQSEITLEIEDGKRFQALTTIG